jgi:hypothetical protein
MPPTRISSRCACTFPRQISPGAIPPARAWRCCPPARRSCPSCGGRLDRPAMAATCHSSCTAAACRRSFPGRAAWASRSSRLCRRVRILLRRTRIGGFFRQLNDWVKGDALRSLPGFYQERNPVVRQRFDALEQAFANQLPQVMRQAEAHREHDPAEMARILDQFTAACIEQVTAELTRLLGL